MLQTNLVNQIYDLIVKKIISGDLKMGEKIIISSIAKEYNVSPTPVREALNKLTKEGLVENIPNVGNFVFKIDKKGMKEILYIRELLERSSLQYTLKEQNIETFKRLLDYFNDLKNEKDKYKIRQRFYQLDTEIHLSIIKSTFNHRLIEMYGRIFNILFIFILKMHHSDERYGQNYDHCIELLEAITEKKYLKAKKSLELHFKHTRKYLKKYFKYRI